VATGGAAIALLTVSGYIINRERIEISPRFQGVVKWIGVKKGDAVKKDQTVVLLDDAEQNARVAETNGRLASAHVALDRAELNYRRVRELTARNVVSKEADDEARLSVAAAKAAIAEIEGQLALAKTYLDWTIIRSPIDGVVLEKLAEPGELVTPQSFGGARGPSTAVLAVADLQDLQVEIDVSETDLAKISLGQRCQISPEAYPEKHYDGVVAEISPEANRQKGTLQIKVQIKQPDRFLTPELSAKVDFLPQP
jgi:HlyD family secretion protein